MKQFVLITESESGDTYSYCIEHPTEPTSKELKRFLKKYASDQDEDEVYEYPEKIIEVTNLKTIPKNK